MEKHEVTKTTITPQINLKKLSKQNGYVWEIKISDDDIKNIPKRLEEINNMMIEKYGVET